MTCGFVLYASNAIYVSWVHLEAAAVTKTPSTHQTFLNSLCQNLLFFFFAAVKLVACPCGRR